MIGFSFRRMALTGLTALGLSAVAAGPALAQNAVIRGTVTSQDRKEPISGVNIVITELNISVLSSDRGAYAITVPAARIPAQPVFITARAIGFKAVQKGTLIRAGEQTVDFTLQTDVNRLEEVVVTGVMEGTERAKVPFAVGRLTAEDLPVPALDPIRALAGKVAGVRIAQTSGKPGTTPEILLRGPTSINASGRSQEPLIIVDGAIIHVGSLEELGGLDIESVEVVKGAAGASLYGTQAANGVITITTKRGGGPGGDGVKFNVRTEYGVSDLNSSNYGQPANHHLQLDETGQRFCVSPSGFAHCSRTVSWMGEILRINNVAADTTRTPQPITYNAPGVNDIKNLFQTQIWPGQYYNSLAQVMERNPIILTAIDATGKIGSVGFYVSGSYQDEAGAIRGLNGVQQRRGRVNLDYNARQDLKISVSTLYDNLSNDLRSGGSSNGGIFGQLLRGAPAGTNYAARDTLGRLLVRGGGSNLRGTGNGGGTFLYDSENNINDRTSNRFLGSITGRYFPTDWVTFEGTFAYDNRTRFDRNILVKGYRTQGPAVSSALNFGQMSVGQRKEEALNGQLTATLRKKFGKDLNGKLRFSGGYDQDVLVTNASSGEQFRVAEVYQTSNLATNYATSSSSQTIKNVGVSVAATADYKDRYVLEGSFRYDGSSLFGSGNRWSPFGRISGVWQVSHEPFWHVGFMDEFRLRASRGTAGSTPPFAAQYETYSVSATGFALGQAGNAKLRPETTTEYEFGTDFTLFRKLGFEITYATGKTKDQILPVRTPAALGFATQWQNAGTLLNKTLELGVSLPVVNSKSLYWNMRGTWDRTRTYIDELFVPEFVYAAGTGQGTDGYFHVTADRNKQCEPGELGHYAGETRTNCSGPARNRWGNIYGRRFLKYCKELPESVRSDCGTATSSYQVNDQGWLVWVGAGNSWKDGVTRNLWQTKLPQAQSPWNVPLQFGHPIVDRPLRGQTAEGVGINQIIGNVFQNFRFTFTNDIQYKRVTLYGLLDGTIGHKIDNQGEGWGLLDFSSANFDQSKQTVETAKPVSYGWRVGQPENAAGAGGFYDVLGSNNYVVEDGSFVKLRELSLTYKVGRVAGVGDWTVGVIGRNLLTLTNYTGLDPETGVAGGSTGSGLINQVDAFDFPTLRTFTISLSTRF